MSLLVLVSVVAREQEHLLPGAARALQTGSRPEALLRAHSCRYVHHSWLALVDGTLQLHDYEVFQ